MRELIAGGAPLRLSVDRAAKLLRTGGFDGEARSDIPIPRLSNRITRANDANRRWNRAIEGSSSMHSIGMLDPEYKRRSIGPSPNT
jgi:hypothetical protein